MNRDLLSDRSAARAVAAFGDFTMPGKRSEVDGMPVIARDRDARLIAMVDSIHADNLGGKHRNGFCEACADAYLVVQRALADDRGAVEDCRKLRETLTVIRDAHEPDDPIFAAAAGALAFTTTRGQS